MSAARTLPVKHFQSLLTRWPVDSLRPDCQLQNVLAKRLGTGKLAPTVPKTFKSQENADLVQFRPRPDLLEPKSNPTYYKDVLKEIEEAPHRTWWQRIAKRITGMIRLQ
ncbi:uncharacterized protein CTHT_0049640 [Thermochaetoides thermophila DSM 1495]|uniref:Uncharacterized protein n=1 Tax=Chaetomium thermophilum (strain DSM 1495 / CBS 144.50 / IMI 039719) TaxID=759272 RepID=G0SBB6_CHATD|nr:hypothetical protein CTHT_0049640 [Thermochaetoides thermophila DSM 1495]EGS19496.1 hypothetical protein CTHT_0049640 [Thermochaetoides thermophila DSM 1495]